MRARVLAGVCVLFQIAVSQRCSGHDHLINCYQSNGSWNEFLSEANMKPGVSIVDLRLNSLTFIPPGAFNKLTALKDLRLGGNSLTSVPQGIFSNLAKLEELSLDGNRIRSLPSGVFDQLTSLKSLKLSSNLLTLIPPGLFSKLTRLGTLTLFNNSLTSLPTNAFDNLPASTAIFVNGNPWKCKLKRGDFSQQLPVCSEAGSPSDPRTDQVLAACSQKWAKNRAAIRSINSVTQAIGAQKTFDCPTPNHCCLSSIIFQNLKAAQIPHGYSLFENKCIKTSRLFN